MGSSGQKMKFFLATGKEEQSQEELVWGKAFLCLDARVHNAQLWPLRHSKSTKKGLRKHQRAPVGQIALDFLRAPSVRACGEGCEVQVGPVIDQRMPELLGYRKD